jgi:hypothetical protein
LLVNVAVGGGSGSGNVNITGINSNPPALTNPLPVELSDGTNAFGTAGNPLSVNVITGGGSNASVGSNGAGAPTSSTQIGGSDGVDLQPLQVDASKNLKTVINAALPAGSNVIGHVIADSGSTTAVTQATASNLNATVVGTKTNNNAAPGATNVGTLPAVANAAAQSWTEGDQVALSVDLSGHQRVVATGAAADSATPVGNPVLIAGYDSNDLVVKRLGLFSSGAIGVGGLTSGFDALGNTAVLQWSGATTIAVAPMAPFLFNGTTWDRARSAGVGNAVAATGLGAQVAYVQYNTTLPAPTAGQYTAAQCDTTGSTYVNMEGRKATYSAFASFTAVAGDIAVLPGSASKTIRVLRVEVSFVTSGTAAVETVQLVKRSAADTGGTSAAMTAVAHDSTFAGASAAPLSYTVAPTPGAAVGTIRGVQFNDASSALPGANTWIWDFGTRPSAAIVLRGVAQQLAISLPTAIATQTAQVSYEWSEE